MMDWIYILLSVCIAFVVVGSYLDTKARILRIEQKLNLLLVHSGVDPVQGQNMSERVKEIARDPARKIEAIKVYREETGAGLAVAKNAVEAYIHSL